MSRCDKIKILFYIKIFFDLFNGILSNSRIFESMSLEDKKYFFETPDGSVPEFELVELSKLPRSKRSPDDTFEITFGTTTVSMNIVHDNDLIGRTITGIWFAESNRKAYHNVIYTPQPDFLEYIGNIDFFRSVDDSSALTRFRNSEGHVTYRGYLHKGKYTLKSIPHPINDNLRNFSQNHTVKTRSKNSIKDQDYNSSTFLVIFKTPEDSQKYFSHQRRAQLFPTLPNIDPHRKKRQNPEPIHMPNVVYPKLLIAPDYDLILQYRTVKEFIRQFIGYMNTVDMFYRKLRDPEVRLRIAGIIIPQDKLATPYITQNTFFNKSLIGMNVLYATNKYFFREENRFPFHTYDIIIVMVKDYFTYYDHLIKARPIGGLSFSNSACGRIQLRNGGAAIVKFDTNFESIAFMAHELGYIVASSGPILLDGVLVSQTQGLSQCRPYSFGVYHDGRKATKECQNDDFSLFLEINSTHNVEWSNCSKQAISLFLRSGQASCMHNRPYEIPDTIKSMQGAWMPMSGQCQNRFRDAFEYCLDKFPMASCGNYGCLRNGICVMVNDPPMQGAYCENGKRCINQECILIQ